MLGNVGFVHLRLYNKYTPETNGQRMFFRETKRANIKERGQKQKVWERKEMVCSQPKSRDPLSTRASPNAMEYSQSSHTCVISHIVKKGRLANG
jgi:hypothetical protein